MLQDVVTIFFLLVVWQEPGHIRHYILLPLEYETVSSSLAVGCRILRRAQ